MPRERKRAPIGFYLFLGLANVLFLLLLEAGARVYFSTQVGPRVLLYGTRWHRAEREIDEERQGPPAGRESAQFHRYSVGDYRPYVRGEAGSYSKYFPNEIKTLRDVETREFFPVRINSQGFRGKDFTEEKPAGTLRVLTLGGSSTFGYGSRDDETYPHVLEEILNRRSRGGWRFEVINFGIPHAITDNIVALLLAEGVPLEPDFVTLYTGANDSAIVEDAPGLFGRLGRGLSDRFVLLAFANHLAGSIAGPSAHLWSDEYAARRSGVFLENVERLLEECRKRNIQLIVASQQAKSFAVDRKNMKRFTYADEVELVRRRARDSRLIEQWRGLGAEVERRRQSEPGEQPAVRKAVRLRQVSLGYRRTFLIHARLMRHLTLWAAANDVPFVDVIELLDRQRHQLLSWVHLHAEANRAVAEAFAGKILELSVPVGRAAVAAERQTVREEVSR